MKLRLLCALVVLALPAAAETLFVKTSEFGTVVVAQEGPYRIMKFREPEGEVEQSRLDLRDPARLHHRYTQLQLLGLLFPDEPRSVLVVGLGGASLPRTLSALLPGARIDNVEIDPVVVEAARKFFFYQEGPLMRTFVADARDYVRQTDERYDLIVLDAFDGLEVPAHLRTLEFYQELSGLLTPSGVVVTNLHTNSDLYASDLVTLQAAFQTIYPFAATAQRVVVCQNRPPVPLSEVAARAATWRTDLNLEYPLEEYARDLDLANPDPQAPILRDESFTTSARDSNPLAYLRPLF